MARQYSLLRPFYLFWGSGGNFASLIAFAVLYGAFAGGYSVFYGCVLRFVNENRSSALWISSILEFQRGAASFGSGFLNPVLLTNVITKGHHGITKYEKLVWFIGASLLASSLTVVLRQINPRPRPWRAPTWPWAFIGSPTTYLERADISQDLTHVLETQCSVVGEDIFGEITAARIVLRGPVVQVTLCYRSDDLGSDEALNRRYYITNADVKEINMFSADYQLHHNDKYWVEPETLVHCLEIAEDRYTVIFSLVLRCMDWKTGAYERIGTLLQRPNDFSIGNSYNI